MIPASRRRLVVLYIIVAALLVGLGGRLWYLQVLTGTAYASLARQDQVRTVIVPSVRGQILDDLGAPLVGEKPSLVVSANMAVVSQRPRGGTAGAAQPGRLLGMRGATMLKKVRLCTAGVPQPCWAGSPYQPIPVDEHMTRPSSRCRSWRATASFPALPPRSSR